MAIRKRTRGAQDIEGNLLGELHIKNDFIMRKGFVGEDGERGVQSMRIDFTEIYGI